MRHLFTLAAFLILTSAAFGAGQPTTAEAYLAAAPVTYVGADWGPVPIYRVDLRPQFNETVDVAANSPAEARQNTTVVGIVKNYLKVAGMLAEPADPPLPPNTAPALAAGAVLDTTPAVIQTVDQPPATAPALNPTLTTVMSAAVSKPVTFTKATVCTLSGKRVACARLYTVLKHSKRRMTVKTVRGKVTRVTVA